MQTEPDNTKSYYKLIVKMNEKINKDVVSRLRTVAVKVKYSSSILFWPPFLRLVVHSNYFLVLIGQEARNLDCDWLIQLVCPITGVQ